MVVQNTCEPVKIRLWHTFLSGRVGRGREGWSGVEQEGVRLGKWGGGGGEGGGGDGTGRGRAVCME